MELLYDLVFVVAFGIAGSHLAHSIAAGHPAAGVGASVFTMWAVIWAWMGFTTFASAYDTDDWLYRILALVQMIGVSILAMGIGDIFASMEEPHQEMHNEIMVLG